MRATTALEANPTTAATAADGAIDDARMADLLLEFRRLAEGSGDRTLLTLAEMALVQVGRRIAARVRPDA